MRNVSCIRRPSPRARRAVARLSGGLMLAVLSGCARVPSLQPKGLAARRIADLWWFMFVVALAFLLAVVILLLLAIRRHTRGAPSELRNDGMRMILWGGGILPALAMLALIAYTTRTLVAVTEPREQAQLTVDVHGVMWWWRIAYGDGEQAVNTANEIHIPSGEPVALMLYGDDVIHSFWVPELNGKRDLTPGIPGPFWLQADQPGTFRGRCAEFCGAQHAKMNFLVIAHEPDEFQQWLEHERQPAVAPVDEAVEHGQDVFLTSGCSGCHTIRGTPAAGTVGPDLTHVASRVELGAGTLLNNAGNLAAWIIDSQQFKPSNLMPSLPLASNDLIDLVGYLQTLR